jgi:hypothetical protein
MLKSRSGDLLTILELVECIETRPDLPEDWPGEDAVNAFEEAYNVWLESSSGLLNRLRGVSVVIPREVVSC